MWASSLVPVYWPVTTPGSSRLQRNSSSSKPPSGEIDSGAILRLACWVKHFIRALSPAAPACRAFHRNDSSNLWPLYKNLVHSTLRSRMRDGVRSFEQNFSLWIDFIAAVGDGDWLVLACDWNQSGLEVDMLITVTFLRLQPTSISQLMLPANLRYIHMCSLTKRKR